MKTKIILMTIVLAFFGLSANVNAQWVQTTLTNETVNCLAASGNNIFAGTYNHGVFLSQDNGDTWTAVNNGLGDTTIWSLATSGNNIFAGTSNAGLFLSTDNGDTWTSVNNGLGDTTVIALAVNGNNVFAGTGQHGVFLSQDNGDTWTSVNTGLTNPYIQAITINGNNIFVGTFDGLFLSTDNGNTWTAKNNGLPAGKEINVLTTSENNIFAGAWSAGLFLSTDNGNTWTAANTGLPTNIDIIKGLAISGNNIFAGTSENGIFLSINNGINWTPINTGLTNNCANTLIIDGNNIFAGSENVWKRPLSDFNGINEINNNSNVSIFPNPFVDKINIRVTDTEKIDAALFNSVGDMIYKNTLCDLSINTENFPNGVYFLKVTFKNKTSITTKLVK